MIRIEVKLFARARDLAGPGPLALELSDGATVESLRSALASRWPTLGAFLKYTGNRIPAQKRRVIRHTRLIRPAQQAEQRSALPIKRTLTPSGSATPKQLRRKCVATVGHDNRAKAPTQKEFLSKASGAGVIREHASLCETVRPIMNRPAPQ